MIGYVEIGSCGGSEVVLQSGLVNLLRAGVGKEEGSTTKLA